MKTVVVRYEPRGSVGGYRGCWQAAIKNNPGIWGGGTTAKLAVESCIRTAVSLDATYTLDQAEYATEVAIDTLPHVREIDQAQLAQDTAILAALL